MARLVEADVRSKRTGRIVQIIPCEPRWRAIVFEGVGGDLISAHPVDL